MMVIDFEQGNCIKIRTYLDSYLSDELLIETNHEVLRHLERCSDCRRELEDRTRARTMLRAALRRETVNDSLRAKIQRDLRAQPEPQASPATWWGLAAVAMVVLSVGTWSLLKKTGVQSAAAAPLLELGVTDHVHCAVAGYYPSTPPTSEEMVEGLGSEYAGMLPVMKSRLAGYTVREGHRCVVEDREFVHMIMTRPDILLSLSIARKQAGESFGDGATPLHDGGIHDGRINVYSAAGFETPQHLAFIVSNLHQAGNRQAAGAIAGSVRGILLNLERRAERPARWRPGVRPAIRGQVELIAVGLNRN